MSLRRCPAAVSVSLMRLESGGPKLVSRALGLMCDRVSAELTGKQQKPDQ